MRRTLFTMGFGSPTAEYGPINQGPQLGVSWSDVGNFFKGVSAPVVPAPVAPVIAPPQTILGMPQDTVLTFGAIALGLGLVIAIVASRKNAAAPATAPAAPKKKK